MRSDVQLMLKKIASDPGLAASVKTKGGVVFAPSADIWAFRDGSLNVSLPFGDIRGVTTQLLQSFKATLIWYAVNTSPSTLVHQFKSFKYFVALIASGREEPIEKITEIDFLNYRSTSKGKLRTAHLKAFFRRWYRLKYPGMTPDLIKTLDSTREKAFPKGVAVATMDPKKGPFTDIELRGIQSALNDAYAKRAVSEANYILTWLFMALGARPTQFSLLKVRDVHSREVDGVIYYDIDVPRAKQSVVPRALFKNRPLIKQVGAPLVRYASAIASRFSNILEDPLDAPLFPQENSDDETSWAPGLAYHRTAARLSHSLADVLSALEVKSERTSKSMRISAVRFRRTFGTRAAQEGHSVLVIAELLDHSDIQNAGVYVETRPEIATRIDKAVSMELAPIAQAFKGRLISQISDATRANDPSARIRDLRVDANDLAYCGQKSSCAFNAPIACYECTYFEPWLDGPHEALLDMLLAKREAQMSTCDSRIATVLDRTILAVAEVVQLCRQRKGENFDG